MKTLAALLLVLAATLSAASALPEPARTTEGPSTAEVQASVPELFEFHEAIFTLWHKAWPKKDLALMTALLPEIEAGTAKLQKVTLPGILRDKKTDWDAAIVKLGEIVAEYRSAVGSQDLQKTLDAGEKLHSQFEVLVRTIRPALPEVDSFHRVLYRLYHYELPLFSLPTVQASVKELKEKMTALNAVVLPPRMESKKEAFQARRSDLSRAVDSLAALAEAGKDEKAIQDAIEEMHRRYVLMEDVF